MKKEGIKFEKMEINKLKYYLGGILFIVIALISVIAIGQKSGGSNMGTAIFWVNVILAIVFFPIGLWLLNKGRKMK